MSHLPYIDELQDSKCLGLRRKRGGSPPLPMDFLQRKIDGKEFPIDPLQDEICSTITEKNGTCLPLGTNNASLEKFDLIVKKPASELLRALRYNRVEIFLNDFLDTIFNLGIDEQDENLRETPPLIYADHKQIRHGQKVTEVKVLFQHRLPSATDELINSAKLSLCDKIHSAKAREHRTCSQYLSTLDIFGLEPVRNTDFLICWDSAFFSQIISGGQVVLGSLGVQVRSLESKLRGQCQWFKSNLILLTQILISKGADILCSNPKELLEAAGSVLLRLVGLKNALRQPKATWTNQVQQASQSLGNITAQITTLANLAKQAEPTNPDLREQAKKLYFASHEFLDACAEVILGTQEIYSRFWEEYILGGGGIGLGIAGIAYGVAKGGLGGAIGAVFGAVGVVAGGVKVWETRQYRNICEALTVGLETSKNIVVYCEADTRRLFLPQARHAAVGHAAASDSVRRWREFMNKAICSTKQDPGATAFNFNRHYSSYLETQNSALEKARRDMETELARSRSLENHLGVRMGLCPR